MSQRGGSRRLAASLALGGLCLLPAWDAILALPGSARGWEPLAWLVGGTLLACGLAAVALGVWSGIGRTWRSLSVVALVVCLVETVAFVHVDVKNTLAVHLGPNYVLIRNIVASLLAAGALAVGVSVWRLGGWRVLAGLMSVLAVLAPLPLVLLISFVLGAASPSAGVSSAALAQRMVVVLVFDELDDSAISADLAQLPNFATLRAQGLSASRMYPPANYTSESLPGMLTGENFAHAVYSRTDVHVQPVGESVWHRLSRRGTLFDDALDQGRRVAVIGWHLPYCAFAWQVASCWDDASYRAPGAEVSLPVWLLGHSRLYSLYESRRLAGLAGNLRDYSREFLASAQNYRLRRIGGIYADQKRELLSALDGRRHELVFAHLACPHAPSLLSAEVDMLDMYDAYARNLRECDHLLGEVMRRLREAGPKGGWALAVTSDHWFRGRDWLDAGRPLALPAERRTVPFHLLVSGRGPAGGSTDALTNSRVLRRLTRAAAEPGFDLEQARAILGQQGDSVTILRPF